MPAKRRKPPIDLVQKAAEALRHPEYASQRTIKRMAAEVVDNQQYNPQKPKARKPQASARRKKQ